ncbi:MAG TPA: triphosphoribosyl-dephospho-CoA synthase [Xanthobacteraceae bacterium]|nr:triphosphoribosyl-dephospho-CoA synthase [Xanthobacteraceae bacterium]
MCYGQSIFHKSHGERRPSRFDPQRRRSAQPQARTTPGPWRKGGATNPEQLFAGGVVHQSFVTRRLSPGGSADLLAMTLFIHACEAEFLSCRM